MFGFILSCVRLWHSCGASPLPHHSRQVRLYHINKNDIAVVSNVRAVVLNLVVGPLVQEIRYHVIWIIFDSSSIYSHTGRRLNGSRGRRAKSRLLSTTADEHRNTNRSCRWNVANVSHVCNNVTLSCVTGAPYRSMGSCVSLSSLLGRNECRRSLAEHAPSRYAFYYMHSPLFTIRITF